MATKRPTFQERRKSKWLILSQKNHLTFLSFCVQILLHFCAKVECTRIQYYCKPERIESNLEMIQSAAGVPLDFRFNETSSDGQDSLVSVAGCPKSIDGYPWLYYYVGKASYKYDRRKTTLGPQHRCFLAGHQGPCPFGQVLFLQSGSPFGVCGCECLLNVGAGPDSADYASPFQDSQQFKQCHSSLVGLNHGQVYTEWDLTVCYNLLEQGPCSNGEILAVSQTTENSLVCLPRCDLNDRDWYSKYEGGQCTAVGGGGGFAGNLLSNSCPPGERFSGILKRCVKREPHQHLVIG